MCHKGLKLERGGLEDLRRNLGRYRKEMKRRRRRDLRGRRFRERRRRRREGLRRSRGGILGRIRARILGVEGGGDEGGERPWSSKPEKTLIETLGEGSGTMTTNGM